MTHVIYVLIHLCQAATVFHLGVGFLVLMYMWFTMPVGSMGITPKVAFITILFWPRTVRFLLIERKYKKLLADPNMGIEAKVKVLQDYINEIMPPK